MWSCVLWCNSQFFFRQGSGRSLHTFSHSPRKTSQCFAELTARMNYLWTIPFMSKKTLSMLISLLFSCLAIFGVPWTEHVIQTPVCGSCFLRQTLLIITRVSVALFPIFAQSLTHTRCRIHRENASAQIHDSKYKDVKNQHIHPAAWNCIHWLPRYASTIIYRCIALLQLLYR
jgi:hypothetical protein